MVYYRKYRPQTIADLDSTPLRETLTAVLSAQELPHAFLFTGPKGLGKTSTARIVAKAVNCEENEKQNKGQTAKDLPRLMQGKAGQRLTTSAQIEPCNNCTQCVSITNGSNLDVLEIDAASNRGIDEIRDLREKARLAPVSARKKVYIIDEVHMLTTEAFNALLKTLEEPPAHVLFILCTTESHKIPATIFSRCFHVQFTLATTEELTRSFRRIAQGEGIAIDDDALTAIAKLSDGSFRDGAKAFEEIVLVAKGEKITKRLIEEKFNITSLDAHVSSMLQLLFTYDTKKALHLTTTLTSQGVDTKYFITQLITRLHAGMLRQLGVEDTLPKNEEVTFTFEQTKQLVELLTKAFSESKYAVVPILPLEMAIIAWGQNDQNNELRSMNYEEKKDQNGETKQKSMQKLDAKDKMQKVLDGQKSVPEKVVKADQGEKVNIQEKRANGVSNSDFWKEFLEKVNQENKTLAGVLRGCHLQEYTEQHVLIETSFKFHKERLNDPKALSFLEQVVKNMTGNTRKITISLKQ